MQTRTLTIVCPGTGMRWEDMAIVLGLNINKRHNVEQDSKARYPDQLYYCLDGPAVAPKKVMFPHLFLNLIGESLIIFKVNLLDSPLNKRKVFY